MEQELEGLLRKVVELPSLEGFKTVQIWHLRTWFNGECGTTTLIVGLDDLGGLYQI